MVLGEVVLSDPNGGSDVVLVQVKCSCGSNFFTTKDAYESGEVRSCGTDRSSQGTDKFRPRLNPVNRRLRIQLAAYYQWLADGEPIDDGKARWLAAEKRVNEEFPQEK